MVNVKSTIDIHIYLIINRGTLEVHDRVGTAAEILARLATACDDLALGAIMCPFASDFLAGALNVDVEAARQTAIGRDRDDQIGRASCRERV